MPELKSEGDDNIVAIEAAKIVERVVGIAWATDKSGNFIYLSEPLLSTKNLSINQLNKPVKKYYSGWEFIVHPDDCEAMVSIWRDALLRGNIIVPNIGLLALVVHIVGVVIQVTLYTITIIKYVHGMGQ